MPALGKKSSEKVELWTKEYRTGGIPSSSRTEPSGAVVWAFAKLNSEKCRLKTAVDVGCGKGRNSIYLAENGMHVTAMDFTPNAISNLSKSIAEHGLEEKIRPVLHDVTEAWPVGSNAIDLVVDAFCFKHITPHDNRLGYKNNLLNVLAARGHYMISFASIGDGYYGRYIMAEDPVSGGEVVVIDPVNGIESVLFTRDRVVEFFFPELDLFAEVKHNRVAVMHGQKSERETYALLFKRTQRKFAG